MRRRLLDLTVRRSTSGRRLGARLLGRCLAALLLTATPTIAASDWSSFRGAAGTGAVSSGRQSPASGLRAAWQRPIGSGYSGIVPAGDRIVTCAAQDGRDVLVALDARSGDPRWAVDLGEMNPGRGGSLDGAIATPAVAHGVAYAFGPRGRVVAVEVADGKELWRRELASEDATVPYYGFASSPVVHGDLVIVQLGGEAGSVVALERASGQVAWRAGNAAVEAQSPRIATLGGRTQLVVATNDWIGGLDPEEGTLLWTWPYQSSSAFVLATSPLVLPEGLVFMPTSNDSGALLRPPAVSGHRAQGAAQPTADVVWQANVLTRTYSPAALIGDSLVGYTSRFLGAYSAMDGALRWRSRTPGDGFLIGVDGRAVVITKEGSLHLGEVEGGWNELATLELFEQIVWTPPAYDATADAVYVRSMTEIARVDLVRDEPARITAAGRARDEASTEPLPAVLAGLLQGGTAELGKRIDDFLQDLETPLVDGDRALFLWRGEATDVGIAGDFLGMRREAPFRRVDGTDLWWYETSIDPRLQYSYFVAVDLEPRLDPSNPRTTRATIWGYDANWVREPVEMSWFAGPRWPGPARHLRAEAKDPESVGTIETIEVAIDLGELPEGLPEAMRSRVAGGVSLQVWLPPGYHQSERRYPTVYVMPWPGVLEPGLGRWTDTINRAAGAQLEPPIVVVLEQPFLMTRSLVKALDERLRTETDRSRRALVGWGFVANDAFDRLASLHDLVGRFGVQSYFGFFGDEVDRVLAQMAKAVGEGAELSGYLDWGVLETRSPSEGWDMGASSRRVFEGLRELGIEVEGGEVQDTSDWKSWRNRTHLLLGTLFPARGEP